MEERRDKNRLEHKITTTTVHIIMQNFFMNKIERDKRIKENEVYHDTNRRHKYCTKQA